MDIEFDEGPRLDQRKQLSDRLARRHAEKRMRCIEKVRAADRDVSDAALEALDEKLCDERAAIRFGYAIR